MMNQSYRFHAIQILMYLLLSIVVLPNGVLAHISGPCEVSFYPFFDDLRGMILKHTRTAPRSENLRRSSPRYISYELCSEIAHSEIDIMEGNVPRAIRTLHRFVTLTESLYPEYIDLTSRDLIAGKAKQIIAGLEEGFKKADLDGDGILDTLEDQFRKKKQQAERGDAKAQSDLGRMYADGRGVAQNIAEARKWYLKSAERGDSQAQYSLWTMYLSTGDYTQALKWLHRGANKGNSSALLKLGRLYAEGSGVKQDKIEAYKWIRLIRILRPNFIEKTIRKKLKKLENSMTPEQTKRGEQLVKEWQESHPK